MPKPKTKQELVELSQSHFKRLNKQIDAFSVEKQQAAFPEGTLNRNVRDVLVHLHHWHVLFLDWYVVGMGGKKPDMPAKGYTWKTTSALNRKIWEDYQSTSLEAARKLLESSFQDVYTIIQAHSEEELFEKKRYAWTGSTSLGAYLISATSSHYDWAFKLIKKAIG